MPGNNSPSSNSLIRRGHTQQDSSIQVPGENTLLRSRYRQFLESPEDYSDLSFSPAEAEFIRRKISHLSTGAFAAIPLICTGDRCPFRNNCPFFAIGKFPTGKACLVEQNLLKEWTLSFIYEYDVHPESLTDRIAVQELAETELLLYRINSNLAKLQYGELVAESVSSVTPRGDVIYEEKVVPLMDLKLRLSARRDRVIKSLVGDREGKYKKKAALKQQDTDDASSRGATLRHQLEKLQRDVGSFAERVEKENNQEEEEGIIVVREGKKQEEESNAILETTAEKVMDNEELIEREKEERERIAKKKEKEEKAPLSAEEFMMEQFSEEDHSDE